MVSHLQDFLFCLLCYRLCIPQKGEDMNEYLFPVPGKALREVLDSHARCSLEPWSEILCIQDIMLAMDRQDVKPYRYYAKRWNRPKTWVGDRMKRFKETVKKQRNFHNSFTKNPDKAGQNPDKAGQKTPNLAHSGHNPGHNPDKAGQTPDSIDQIQIPDTYKNNKTLVVFGKQKSDAPNVKWRKRYEEVMASWNSFAQKNDLSKITKLSDNRRKWIRARYEKIWPNIETIYENLQYDDYLMGRTASFDGITFETLWRNKEHYLKYLEKTPNKQRKQKRLELVGSKYTGNSAEASLASQITTHKNGTTGRRYKNW